MAVNKKYRIVISGIGGVGGFIGGLLANRFKNDELVEIIFFARGKHQQAINEKGLTIITDDQEINVKPGLVTDNSHQIGKVDLIICCTKEFDLEASISQLHPCINRDTDFMTCLNGVNIKERINDLYPDNTVLEGCIYLFSSIKEPGVIESNYAVQTLYLGSGSDDEEKSVSLTTMLKQAGVNAFSVNNIREKLWEKFIFISPLAVISAAHDKCIGEILSASGLSADLSQLIRELFSLAIVSGIDLSEDVTRQTWDKIKRLPEKATTSMLRDFRKGAATEIDTLVGFVVQNSRRNNLLLPMYEQYYSMLLRNLRASHNRVTC